MIQNKKIGHNLVPEQRDFYESWVEFTAKDSTGKEFFHSGGLKPNGFVDEHAHTYTNRLVTKEGKLVDLHQVWATKVRTYDNTIPSGNSDLVRFEVPGARRCGQSDYAHCKSELPQVSASVH